MNQKFAGKVLKGIRWNSTNSGNKTSWKINPRYFIAPILVAGTLAAYYQMDWDKLKLEKEATKFSVVKTHGAPKIGGMFTLVATKDGRPITDSEFRGKWLMIYFGFTHCPDICPTELKKITRVLNKLDSKTLDKIIPIFLSCDPVRDSCESIEKYIAQYHPKFIGLTGTPDQISQAAKKFRVYYTSPIKEFDDGEEYNLDHSIFIYFMQPNGEMSECWVRDP